MRIIELYIEDFRIFKDFRLDLTNNGAAQPLIVLAGINGSGKTTLLKHFIYSALTKGEISKNDYFRVSLQDGQEEFEETFGHLILNAYEKPNLRFVKPALMALFFNNFKKTIFHKTGTSEKPNAKAIITEYIDTLIYEKDVKGSEAYAETQNKLQSIFKNFQLQVAFQGLNKKKEILFKNEFARNIKIEELSGGEQELITKAFTLYLSGVQDTIILIDEPEGSLHPNWQHRIVKIYADYAIENNCQVIMATHSPQIISSVKKEAVRILHKKPDGTVEALIPTEESYGSKVEEILLEIMGVKHLRPPEVDHKLALLKELLFQNDFESPTFKNSYQKLENLLGFADTDMTLIRLEIARRKKKYAIHQ